MGALRPAFRAIAAITLFCLVSSPLAARAAEVDFLDLPFGAKRSSIDNLFDKKAYERDNRVYYLRKESKMQFAGVSLWDVNYGFEKDQLIIVEAKTFKDRNPDGHCYAAKANEAIRKKMVSLFGKRIRQVGYSSPPEEYRRNLADYEECTGRFPSEKKLFCDVDVFERWKPNAKETERALEAAFQIVSIEVGAPIFECFVRLTFQPGQRLSEKLAREKALEEETEAMWDMLDYGLEDTGEPPSVDSAPLEKVRSDDLELATP